MFTFYEVGGKVRDELLGLPSKDYDYVAVREDEYLSNNASEEDIHQVFNDLLGYLTLKEFKIYLITASAYTIRARFPIGHKHEGIDADFVLARKEFGYIEGTRMPKVVPGTLLDDLTRRDFTVNAIAKAENGALVDPFDGLDDIKNRVLATPISGHITFQDDPLRLLRAIRFAVTKGFTISYDIERILKNFDYTTKFGVVSEERIREELYKAFKHDTLSTIWYLQYYWQLKEYIFKQTKLWLEPTNKH